MEDEFGIVGLSLITKHSSSIHDLIKNRHNIFKEDKNETDVVNNRKINADVKEKYTIFSKLNYFKPTFNFNLDLLDFKTKLNITAKGEDFNFSVISPYFELNKDEVYVGYIYKGFYGYVGSDFDDFRYSDSRIQKDISSMAPGNSREEKYKNWELNKTRDISKGWLDGKNGSIRAIGHTTGTLYGESLSEAINKEVYNDIRDIGFKGSEKNLDEYLNNKSIVGDIISALFDSFSGNLRELKIKGEDLVVNKSKQKEISKRVIDGILDKMQVYKDGENQEFNIYKLINDHEIPSLFEGSNNMSKNGNSDDSMSLLDDIKNALFNTDVAPVFNSLINIKNNGMKVFTKEATNIYNNRLLIRKIIYTPEELRAYDVFKGFYLSKSEYLAKKLEISSTFLKEDEEYKLVSSNSDNFKYPKLKFGYNNDEIGVHTMVKMKYNGFSKNEVYTKDDNNLDKYKEIAKKDLDKDKKESLTKINKVIITKIRDTSVENLEINFKNEYNKDKLNVHAGIDYSHKEVSRKDKKDLVINKTIKKVVGQQKCSWYDFLCDKNIYGNQNKDQREPMYEYSSFKYAKDTYLLNLGMSYTFNPSLGLYVKPMIDYYITFNDFTPKEAKFKNEYGKISDIMVEIYSRNKKGELVDESRNAVDISKYSKYDPNAPKLKKEESKLKPRVTDFYQTIAPSIDVRYMFRNNIYIDYDLGTSFYIKSKYFDGFKLRSGLRIGYNF